MMELRFRMRDFRFGKVLERFESGLMQNSLVLS